MDNPRIQAEPAEQPYDIAALKRACRAIDDDQNEWLNDNAPAAARLVEEYLGRSLIQKTYIWSLDSFMTSRAPFDDFWFSAVPSGSPRTPAIMFPRKPVTSVTSITYYDSAGAQQTLAADQYELDTINGRLRPSRLAGTWPQTEDRLNAVTITFVAGYGTTHASVPLRIKTGIHALVAHWFETREALTPISLGNVPLGFFDMIEDYRQQGF